MTERPQAARARAGRRAATLSWLAASVTFALALALVGLRMASGHDPSLGASAPAAPVAEVVAPRRVIVRRIERRVIVTRVLPPRRPRVPIAPTGAPVAAAAPAAGAPAYVPAQRAAYVPPPRPAYVPPVRAVAPPAAPAPAPHAVTRAS
jgi:hypothetical protein